MYSRLLLLSLFILPLISSAQSLTMNQIKYWDYRERLKTEFMVLGGDKGESLAAESWEPEVRRMRWADATVYHGWYIGMLATEYVLGSNGAYLRTGEGKDIAPEATLVELYYALKTLERLDLSAEPFFDETAEPALNGFFIRDDVGKEIKEAMDINHLQTDYNTLDLWPRNEASQDQVYHLMMGLMCVKELIPADTQVKGEYLKQMAVAEGIRIIEWIKVNDWKVKNPARLKSNGKMEKVSIGHQAYIFSEGLSRILEKLKESEAVMKKSAVKKEKSNVDLLHKVFWSSMRMGVNPTYASNDNRHMALVTIATGNGFKKRSYTKLVKRSDQDLWFAYPLINRLLYPDNKVKKKDDTMELTLQLLNDAPASGPKCPWPERREQGWGANHMFLKDREYQKDGRKFHVDKHWNGLDYMMLFNLYMIQRNGLAPASN